MSERSCEKCVHKCKPEGCFDCIGMQGLPFFKPKPEAPQADTPQETPAPEVQSAESDLITAIINNTQSGSSQRIELLKLSNEAFKAIRADMTSHHCDGLTEVAEVFEKERAAERERYAKVVEVVEEIRDWADAYPITVFKEPTTEQVHSVCNALGVTVDCISAWVLRQFTKPWGDKARKALRKLDEGGVGEACPECGSVAPYPHAPGCSIGEAYQ